MWVWQASKHINIHIKWSVVFVYCKQHNFLYHLIKNVLNSHHPPWFSLLHLFDPSYLFLWTATFIQWPWELNGLEFNKTQINRQIHHLHQLDNSRSIEQNTPQIHERAANSANIVIHLPTNTANRNAMQIALRGSWLMKFEESASVYVDYLLLLLYCAHMWTVTHELAEPKKWNSFWVYLQPAW